MGHRMTKAAGREFDFFFGEWDVRHRRLTARLAGSDDWQDFAGTSSVRPLLGGLGNIDDNLIHLPDGAYRAISLRSHDPSRGQWAIWWLDGRAPHRLDVPMIGSFDGSSGGPVGTFFAEDTYKGKPIRVRFLWTRTETPSPRWEQAFSADRGVTWETNWYMDFTRK